MFQRNKNKPRSQIYSLFAVKVSHQKRQRKTLLCQLLVPALVLSLIASLQWGLDTFIGWQNDDPDISYSVSPPGLPLKLVQEPDVSLAMSSISFVQPQDGPSVGKLPGLGQRNKGGLLGAVPQTKYSLSWVGLPISVHSPWANDPPYETEEEMRNDVFYKLANLTERYEELMRDPWVLMEQFDPTSGLGFSPPVAAVAFETFHPPENYSDSFTDDADYSLDSPRFYSNNGDVVLDYTLNLPDGAVAVYGWDDSFNSSFPCIYAPAPPGYDNAPYCWWFDMFTGDSSAVIRVNHALHAALTSLFYPDNPDHPVVVAAQGAAERPFPYVKSFPTLQFASFACISALTFIVLFMLPVHVANLVADKEGRMLIMLQMAGLSSTSYYIVDYIFHYILYLTTLLPTIILGNLYEFRPFTQTHPMHLIIALALGGHALNVFSLLLSVFIRSARLATIFSFTVAILGMTFGLMLCQVIYGLGPAPASFTAFAPFGITRMWYILNINCGNMACVETFDGPTLAATNLGQTYFWSFMGSNLYLLLFLYLDAVLPKEFGSPKPVLFFLAPIWTYFGWTPHSAVMEIPEVVGETRRASRTASTASSRKDSMKAPLLAGANEFQEDDLDVLDEAAAVEEAINSGAASNPEFWNKWPVVISDLRKVYTSTGSAPKVAVAGLSLKLAGGRCFGLLGPNGAGKTTTISVLTGLYGASSGSAWIGGHSTAKETEAVHRLIGVCPQFDVLWSDVTVAEHVLLYARLRGVPRSKEASVVADVLKSVSLTKFASRRAGALSGGMKRRLSVGNAIAGGSQILFLDEPSTGLDPESRRDLWNVVKALKPGRVIVLTTHSMAEADELCDRIGIMSRGRLRALGANAYLKYRFGSGYTLSASYTRGRLDAARAFVSSVAPDAQLVDAEFDGIASWHLPGSTQLSTLFGSMEKGKNKSGIIDWGVASATLSEVFERIVTDDTAAAEVEASLRTAKSRA